MRANYVIYKARYKGLLYWRGRFCWDETQGRYTVSKSLNILAEGKRDRRREAEDAAEVLAKKYKKNNAIENIAEIDFIKYLELFWSDNSSYVLEKSDVDKTPLSSSYIKNNRSYIRLHILPCPIFNNETTSNITRKMLRDYKLWCAKKSMSGRLVNQCLQAMRVAIKFAVSNGDLQMDPFMGVGKMFHDEKKKGILTLEEIIKLCEAEVSDYYARLSVLLGCLCGMRRGEVRGLRWGDIGEGIISIQHNWVDGDGAKCPKRKGGLIQENKRLVPMLNVIASLLNKISMLDIDKTKDSFIIQSLKSKGVPVSAKYFDHAIKRELSNIGISIKQQKDRNISFHSLRHSFVTIMRLNGVCDLEIQALAGHSARMMERYSDHKEAIDIKNLGVKFEQALIPEQKKDIQFAELPAYVYNGTVSLDLG